MDILDLNSEKLDKLIIKYKTTPSFKDDLIFKFNEVPDKCTKEELYMIKSLLPVLKDFKIELNQEEQLVTNVLPIDDSAIEYDFNTDEGIEQAVLGMTLSLTISKHFPHKYKDNLVPYNEQNKVLEEILYANNVDLSKRLDFFRETIQGYLNSGKTEGLNSLAKKYKCNLSFVKTYNKLLKENEKSKGKRKKRV